MKLKIFTILSVVSAFAINAQEIEQFEANVGNENSQKYMLFDKLSETTCQFAAIRDIKVVEADMEGEYGFLKLVYDTSNQQDYNTGLSGGDWWLLQNGFPETVTDKDGNIYQVVGIGDFAFANTEMWIPLHFPANYELGKGAFFNCGVSSLDLSNLTDIPDYCFYGLKENENTLDLKKVSKIGKYSFANSSLIPTNFGEIQSISDYSFANCAKIKEIVIPSSIQTIGNGAFYKCTEMKKLKLADSITSIGDYAFTGCQLNGESIFEIPGSVKSIGESAFEGCSMVGLLLNEGLETIGNRAFANCSNIQTGTQDDGTELPYLKIPDTVTSIGDYAFYICESVKHLVMGKSVRKIGKFAFFGVPERSLEHLDLPSCLEEIGYMGLCLKHTGGTSGALSDIYSFASTPPDLSVYKASNPDPETNLYPDGNSYAEDGYYYAFGAYNPDWDGGKFYDYQDHWMYPYICLHVPIGSYEAYRSTPGWSNFKCIIDDLVPEGEEARKDPLSYILGYAFLVPGEKLNIERDILRLNDSSALGETTFTFDWKEMEEVPEEERVARIENGNVEAFKYGQMVALATREGDYTLDSSGNKIPVNYEKDENGQPKRDNNGQLIPIPIPAGAVILFVCPTITLVYDQDVANKAPASPFGSLKIRALAAEGDDDSDTTTDDKTTDINDLKKQNTTYEHRVVYNSFPKLQIEAPTGIEIQTIQRAKVDEDNKYTDEEGSGFKDIEDTQYVEGLESGGNYIVPNTPVQESRVIQLSSAITDNVPTEVEDEVIQLTPEIKVVVNGLTISIEGAQPESVVTVTNTNGQVVYNAKGKTFTMTTKGVYIVRVEDVTFKALVK